MKRLLLPFACVALIVLLVLGYWLLTSSTAPEGKPKGDLDPLLEAASLAVKGVNLLQGEKGFEFWRLKAEWASMQQEKDVIDVREPRVRYTLGEGGGEDYVYVVSELGRITDSQRVLTLWQNVVVTHGRDLIRGPKLVYTADDRIARFPDGAIFDNPDMSGTFTQLRWSMNTNRIESEGGIDMTFKARDPQAAGSTPSAAQPDTGHKEK